MATSQESIFRFIAVRPPDTKTVGRRKKATLYPEETKKQSSFYTALADAQEKGASQTEMKRIAADFRTSKDYTNRLSDLEFDIQALVGWVEANRDQPADALQTEIQNCYKPLNDVVQSDAFQKTFASLADTILCDAIKPYRSQHANDRIVSAFKLMSLIKEMAKGSMPSLENGTVGQEVSAVWVVLPEIALARPAPALRSDGARKDEDQQQKNLQKPQDPKQAEVEELREHLRKLEVARKEFSRIASDPGYRNSPEADESESDPKMQELEQRVGQLAQALQRLEQQQQPEGDEPPKASIQSVRLAPAVTKRSHFLPSRVIDNLKPESKAVLQHLEIDLRRVSPEHILGMIEEEMSSAVSRLPSTFRRRRILLTSGGSIDLDKAREAITGRPLVSVEAPRTPAPASPIPHPDELQPGFHSAEPLTLWRCKFQVGVADLLVVKQVLKAYELADFAHVENVMTGETRDRKHRRLDVREEYIEIETEEEVEKERDLQSTERNEMQTEAEKVVSSQFELSAGTQVSAGLGSSISFSANFDIGYSTSTEETKRKAQSYAREVTQRASERIMERVREERRTRILEEIEETNQHQFCNTTNHHVRGIYRWLNKIYEAEILNYGQRMMFDFTIPEPAAYFLYALVDNPPEDYVLEPPDPPLIRGKPLRPDQIRSDYPMDSQHGQVVLGINPGYYSLLTSQYHVTNAPVPPPEQLTVSYSEAFDEPPPGDRSYHPIARAGKIEIPKDYEAYKVLVDCQSNLWYSDMQVSGSIGGIQFSKMDVEGETLHLVLGLGRLIQGDVSFTLGIWMAKFFALSIHVLCELTDVAMKQWQQDMYDAVMAAYNQQLLDYEDKKAALGLQKGIPILGRNPLENRQIERDEIKRQVITMLMNNPDFEINSFRSADSEDDEPCINPVKACENAGIIRFLEQAFEWENMLYVFYPYFWGRRNRWSEALHITDPDADFAAFLKAGAARVQLPVRPGFEEAVAYYCKTGDVWEGNDVPDIDDELYVPIIDEITAKMGTFDEGLPYPDPENRKPWPVTVPTSLVIVQDLDEIQDIGGIHDILNSDQVSKIKLNHV
jgi:hypothetical protein